jgi:hypothetical protein
VRIQKRNFSVRSKGNWRIAFGPEKLTSHAGLELVRRFVRGSGFFGKLKNAEQRLHLGGDLRFASLVLLFVGMLLVGARRLRHVSFLHNEPMLKRLAGIAHMPKERTLSRKLKQLGKQSWERFDALSFGLVADSVGPKFLPRLTLDMDGSVITTGMQVGFATRGYNPHRRKNPSYYPLAICLAQTGHVIAHKNRTGSVHDSRGAAKLLGQAVKRMRAEMGFGGVIEVRTDGAFFNNDHIRTCEKIGLEYATKVPMWSWLNLRSLIVGLREQDWQQVSRSAGVQGCFRSLPIKAWNCMLKVALIRTHRAHQPKKGVQLDLFNPDDGYWEYSVIATNKTLSLSALWNFMNGRGAQEKIFAELKSGYAYDAVPTNDYRANTAWQKLNILSHNLMTSMQLATTAAPKSRSKKRTRSFLLRTIRTIRFEWLTQAARLTRTNGVHALRLVDTPKIRETYETISKRLEKAA